jgi:TPR repeat protein
VTGAARAARGAIALAALAAASVAFGTEPPALRSPPPRVDPSTCLEDDGKCNDVERLRPECERGSGDACTRLGWAYARGEGVRAPDPAAAERAYAAACRFGEPYGCANLAIILSRDDEPKDPARALTLGVRACDGGVGAGCSVAGFLLFYGRGVEADPARAVELLERGCAKDDVIACCNLAGALARGRGTPRDQARAIRIAAAACEKSTEGCETLSSITWLYETTREQRLEAEKVLRAACARGDEKACSSAEWLVPVKKAKGRRK